MFLIPPLVALKHDSALYLLVNKKFSKVLASSGHMLSNFPEDACCLATGNPMERTLRRDETASFHVLSEGQAYFKLSGILSVCKKNRNLCLHKLNKTMAWFLKSIEWNSP